MRIILNHTAAPILIMTLAMTQSFAKDWFFSPPKILEEGPLSSLAVDERPVCSQSQDRYSALTTMQALDIALCNSPALRQTWAKIKTQAAETGAARAPFYPTVNLSVGKAQEKRHIKEPTSQTTTTENDVMNANLNWRLFDFGGRTADLRAAQAQLNAAIKEHEAALQSKMGEVSQTYFDAVTAHAQQETANEDATITQQLVDATQRREKLGISSHTDVLQAETALARTRLTLSQAQGDEARYLALLTQAMGLPVGTPISLAAGQLAPEHIDDKALESWLSAAERDHPAIKAARFSLEAAGEQVNSARVSGLPTLDLSVSHSINSAQDSPVLAGSSDTLYVGLTIQIPLFDGFARYYREQSAYGEEMNKAEELRETQHRIATEIIRAYTALKAEHLNQLASYRWLAAASAAMDSSMRRYEMGAGDIVELLNAQSEWLNARQRQIMYAAHERAAGLNLLAASGQLKRIGIEQIVPQSD